VLAGRPPASTKGHFYWLKVAGMCRTRQQKSAQRTLRAHQTDPPAQQPSLPFFFSFRRLTSGAQLSGPLLPPAPLSPPLLTNSRAAGRVPRRAPSPFLQDLKHRVVKPSFTQADVKAVSAAVRV
jgi:hypothetical protein